jgi:NADH-quinone oxidoreductase subunit H
MKRFQHCLLFVLLAWISVTLGGCAEDLETRPGAVRAEPGTLVFHPDLDQLRVELHNTGGTPVVVSRFRIEGADWDAFSIVEPMDPQRIDPGAKLPFHVKVDAKRFFGPDARVESIVEEVDLDAKPFEEEEEEIDADEFRDGRAVLRYDVHNSAPPGLGVGQETQAIPIEFEDPAWWLDVIVALVKVHVILLGFVLPLAALLTWVERKQSAMMQDRVGPNMARLSFGNVHIRLWGLLHIVTDGIKMLFKEDFVPRRAHRILYGLAPLMALVPVMVVFAIVPFGDAMCWSRLLDVVTQADVDQCAAGRGGTPLQVAHLDIGLLFYFAVMSLATWGTTLAGWASYNKWAILGALRATAQMISYEVAIGLTIVGALLVYGTLEPHTLVRAQLDTQWGIIFQPIAFVLFFTAAIAETKRAPFDLPEGESEIIGYFIEYSGMRFGLFYLSEFMEIVFVSALVTTLFFGGWALPFGIFGAEGFSSPLMCQLFFGIAGTGITVLGALVWRASKHAENVGAVLVLLGTLLLSVAVYSLFSGWGTEVPHFMVILVGMLTWGIKVAVFCWLQLLIRWTLPRFRYDQLMSLGWKGLLPLSVANIVLTAVVVYLLVPTTAEPDREATPPATRPSGAEGAIEGVQKQGEPTRAPEGEQPS